MMEKIDDFEFALAFDFGSSLQPREVLWLR
jgi:hypothetical protein